MLKARFLLSLIGIVILSACSVSGAATDVVSRTPIPTFIPTSIPKTIEPTLTLVPTIAPTATLSPRQSPRSNRHSLTVGYGRDQNDSVFHFNYEQHKLVLLYGEGSSIILSAAGVALSPDASSLVWLELGDSNQPNSPTYIVDLDLIRNKRTKTLIAQDLQWKIPEAPGRMPKLIPFDPRQIALDSDNRNESDIALNFEIPVFNWSRDSRGFSFTISLLGGIGFIKQAQLYYIQRGTPQALPVAYDATGTAVGINARWSPDSQTISFIRNYEKSGIWLADLTSRRVKKDFSKFSGTYGYISDIVWLPNSKQLIFRAFDPKDIEGTSNLQDGSSNLYLLDTDTGNVRQLTSAQKVGQRGWWTDNRMYGLAEQGKSIVYRTQKLHYPNEQDIELVDVAVSSLNLETGEVRVLSKILPRRNGVVSPTGDAVLIQYGEACPRKRSADSNEQFVAFSFQVISVSDGKAIFDSGTTQCIASPVWSPDGHLVAGYYGDEVFIWDLETGKSINVASDKEMPGRKWILGWVPDPDTWEKLASTKTP